MNFRTYDFWLFLKSVPGDCYNRCRNRCHRRRHHHRLPHPLLLLLFPNRQIWIKKKLIPGLALVWRNVAIVTSSSSSDPIASPSLYSMSPSSKVSEFATDILVRFESKLRVVAHTGLLVLKHHLPASTWIWVCSRIGSWASSSASRRLVLFWVTRTWRSCYFDNGRTLRRWSRCFHDKLKGLVWALVRIDLDL